MHQEMNCCHLSLNMNNILVKNANFSVNKKDGSIDIDSDVEVRIRSFASSEIFKSKYNNNGPETADDEKGAIMNDKMFYCSKEGLTDDPLFTAPQMWDGDVYDARKADTWSLGVIIFWMSTGIGPYRYHNTKRDPGYFALKHKMIDKHLKVNKLKTFINDSLILLLHGLLDLNEQ
eukprot:250990_1